ncbi:hypothetical protein CPB85DRAFT_1430976 [Mucidula mucida]|nr:hypothetical protein CPB85DRAFT_1430976 [Mucidula mucida]
MAAPPPTHRAHVDTPKYQESFSSPNADVVLRSSDNILYRIPSYTLRTTSGFFRTMFSLPQPCRPTVEGHERASCSTFEEVEEEIPTHEPSCTLTPLLLLLSGKSLPTPISQWSFDTLERVLTLAENWDALGPISIIRMAITAPSFLATDPLRVYVLSSHFDWTEERDCAARHTLQSDLLSSPPCILERLSSKDLMHLMRLRRARVETFQTLINDVHRFSAGNNDAYACARCSSSQLDNQTWKDFKQAMLVEIDKRPLGDTVSGYSVDGIGGDMASLGVMAWKEAEQCWAAKCQNADCGAANYDRLTTLKQIKQCVDELPWK